MHKSYNAMYLGYCLDTLTAYRGGPRALRLLRRYWERLSTVSRTGGYSGAPFKGHSITTQWVPLPPTIFNGVLDMVLWNWVSMVAKTEGAADTDTEGFVQDIQRMATYYYSDDGLL